MALAHDAPWSEFMAIAWPRAQERDGHTKIDECPGAVWGFARVGERSTVVSVLGAIIDGSDTEMGPGALKWLKKNTDDLIPPDLMLQMLDRLAKWEPAYACQLYQEEEKLTDEEDAVLLAGVNASNLTTMKEKIARGELPRAKARTGTAIR